MSSDQIQQGRKIAITGHGFDVTENEIRTIFERFGEISEVVYIRNKENGKSKGFSFVVYKDHISAQRAINSMHHDFIFDRRVSVEFARQHKLDDSFASNYSPGLAKPQPYHHPHGVSPNSYRHVRRQQQSDFYHPRPPLEPRYHFPPGYPPLSRAEMNHSPPNRFHSPAQRLELFSKDKSLEVVQESDSVIHPLATPSSLSGTSEQEDGEIPSGPERRFLEPLEDGEMPDAGTPTQRLTDAPGDSFRSSQSEPQSAFSLSNLKMDAATEKLIENIIRIQGSIKMDSNEAQRVWAQGGLRKQKESSPSMDLEPKHQKPAPEQLSPMEGNLDRNEPDLTLHSIAPASRPAGWNHGRDSEQSMPKDLRWEHKAIGPISSSHAEHHLGNPPPFDGIRMLGHPLHEGRDWAPPVGPRHRPDLRHIVGPDKQIVDQNPGNYNYNTYHFQRPLQEPLSRPPYAHTPPSRHVHFPLRHPGPDAPYQGYPQQQQAPPVHNHPSQQQFMTGPGLHPSPDIIQGAGPMMEQSHGAYQHPPADNYPYAPMSMQDQSSGSMTGYAMQFPGGNNALPIDHGMGMQEHSIPPQSLGPHHQQPVEMPGQLIGNDSSTNYQISPATIAQANIAQAAVNSDQSQDLSRSKDPMTLMSRMYVGNLDPKQVNKEDLHDTFSVYGRILDIKIHNHFAFIQFDNPFSCMDAIHTAHSNTIQGQPPKLQLAADGQRARNEMISSGNTSSLPPDPKELPPNMPYPNPFRGQSGHLPTFLTVQPAPQQHLESPIIPQPNFPTPTTPIPMPANIRQPHASQQPMQHNQNTLPVATLGPQPNQPAINPLLTASQDATNAQINAQLLSTALGLDPSALAAILNSLPMLAKGKEDGSLGTKGTQPVKSATSDPIRVGANKRDRSEKESKKRKKKEVEKHAKTKRLSEMEAKKQKAKKKEEELAKVKARLTRDIASVKNSRSKDKMKRKSDSKHESKPSKHFNSEEVYRKLSHQESSNMRDLSPQRAEPKTHGEPTSSRDRSEGQGDDKGEETIQEKKQKPAPEKVRHRTKLSHKTRHESKSQKKSHSPSHKSRKRSRTSESPPSARESPTTQDDIMDQYAYMYDMMTQNPMNRLMKDYHDYYVGIYGYNFSHWSSEYERFLEDYPMDEDTKEMLELMQTFPGYSYYYANMSRLSNAQSNAESPEDNPRDTASPSELPKRVKSSEESTCQDTMEGSK